MTARATLAALAVSLFAALPAAAADWSLSSEESRIGFVSVKAGTVAESHHFSALQGTVDDSGAAEIFIPLDGVETNIDIRNERMREFLFETAKYPSAAITATIDEKALNGLKVGARSQIDFVGELRLHGATSPIETTLTVTRLSKIRVLVETTDPIILYADQFDLVAGLDKLTELAGLSSITPAVPVTASLVFEQN